MVVISARARRELRKMGCGGPNFLRVSRRHGLGSGCGFFVDSSMDPADEVLHDGEIKVVADLSSAPYLKDLAIDFGSAGITVS